MVFLFVAILGSIPADASTAFTGMRNISSLELVKDMRLGWNLGNTLDATGGETSWGNPKTTKEMIDKVKEMGFNTVRFPVTWGGHVGPAPSYTIDQAWLNRVEEVVNYALDNNMYAIVNFHHENSWLKPTYANEAQSKAQLTKIWEQVANRFKNYSDYLIFETMNEPRVEGSPNEWSGGTAENRQVINSFNLAAVNTIRGTGGNNASRHIMIPAHAASAIDAALNDLVIPNNDNRIIISIHNYSPYYFAMDVNGTASWGTASDKSSLAGEFDVLYNRFVKNGRAVVIGEFGTINKSNEAARIAHAEFFVKETRARGITPVWWDNGYSEAKKSDSYGLLNRTALSWHYPEIAKALVRGAGGASNTPSPTRVITPTKASTPTSTPTPTKTPTCTPTEAVTPTPTPTKTSTLTPTKAVTTATPVVSAVNPVPEDINGDKVVNMADIILIASHFNAIVSGTNYNKKCDLNNDGAINMSDVILVALKFNMVVNVSTPTPTAQSIPVFKDVSVHDPSVIKTNGTYYVIGSHLASARTDDLMQWQQVSSSVSNTNPLIPNVYAELKESFDWAQTDTMWAGDIIQLKDGKYYMYYCLCKGDSPRSTLGLAVSDSITGPYKNQGILLKSGMWGERSEDGTVYDATKHPNTVDPDVFFDKNGNLWMVYGSYSGGIYILKMDPATGKPIAGQGYGKKLLGANHSRIEGPSMLYSPETDYYYLFLSFGGLDAAGGYNIRVARSKNPDGPFVDAAGNNMTDCRGPAGTTFDDKAIEPYGVKLMGNFRFAESGTGYVSPGHNSVYYDAAANKYYLIFHTRFPGQGEMHQVRVHQMFINEDGWPVSAPHRYGGETIGRYSLDEISGDYAYVNHGKDISASVKNSVKISLNKDGTVTGSANGKWQLNGYNGIGLSIGGVDYTGVLVEQWDTGLKKFVMTFSVLTRNGNAAAWGSSIN
ncbi:MAG TPA: cellulase family glycosylhydrolase [Pseudobacteroides sp.]